MSWKGDREREPKRKAAKRGKIKKVEVGLQGKCETRMRKREDAHMEYEDRERDQPRKIEAGNGGL